MKKNLQLLEAINLIVSAQTETIADAARITALLAEDLDVNIQIDPEKFPLLQFDSQGLSLLHLAIIHCKPLIVNALLASNKANLQLVNKDGLSALHMVVDYRDDMQQVIQSETMMKEKQIAEAIVKYSNTIDLQDKDGNTALHKAAIEGNVYVVELLLKKDYLFTQQKLLSIRNKFGNTVLHEVARNGKQGKQILSLLLRVASQSDLETKNSQNETPLEMIERLVRERNLFGNNLPHLLYVFDSLDKEVDELQNFKWNILNAAPKTREILSSLVKDLTHLIWPLKQLPPSVHQILKDITNLINDLFNTDQILSKETLLIDFSNLNARNKISEVLQFNKLYVEELRDIEKVFWQTDYSNWKKKVMGLPSSFSDYQRSLPSASLTARNMGESSHQARQATEYYQQAITEFYKQDYSQAIKQLTESLKSYDSAPYLVGSIGLADVHYLFGLCYQKQTETSSTPQLRSENYLEAQKHLEASRDIYLHLQNYIQLEKVYQALAEIQLTQPTPHYEEIQLAILANSQSSNKKRICAHFALASFYELTRRSLQVINPSLKQSLRAYEAYHYSLAYELTQGSPESSARLVLQREMGIGHNIKLGTTNIQQCVAVFAFEPQEGKLVLAHFDKFSGPLTFIEQLFSQFAKEAKLEIFLSGGRDQSSPVSNSNIDQVLKQLYTYRDRINIITSDLGKKPSPPAVFFDPKAKRLVHGVAQHQDINLHIRAARMNLNLNKLGNNDYLYPLRIINYLTEQGNAEGFTIPEQQQLTTLYEHYYLQSQTQVHAYKAWYHNQILYPLLQVLNSVKEDFNKPLLLQFEQTQNNFQISWDLIQNSFVFSPSDERFGSNLDLISMISEQSIIGNAMPQPQTANPRKRLSNTPFEEVTEKKYCTKRRKKRSFDCVAKEITSKNYRKRLNLLQQANDWIHSLNPDHLQKGWIPILTNAKKLIGGREQITFYNLYTQETKEVRLAQQKTLQFRESLQEVYQKLQSLLRFTIHNPELSLHLILNNKNGMQFELPASLENAQTIDGLNAMFTLKTLMAFFRQKNYPSSQTGQDPLSLTLEIHTYVNFAQMAYGTVTDAVKVTRLVKALLHQKRVMQVKPVSLFRFHVQSASTIAEGLGNLLGIIAVGLDIDELTKARTSAERNLFATQLALDTSGLLLSVSSSVAAFLGASSAAISLAGIATPFSGLSIGIIGLVESYNRVVTRAEAVGDYFYRINNDYQCFGYEKKKMTSNEETYYMQPKENAVIKEIDFSKGIIRFGSQFIYRAKPLRQGVFGSGKVNWFSWPMPSIWLSQDQALNILKGLGFPEQVEIKSWKDCKVWILPYTSVVYLSYSWSSLPLATSLNNKGFDVLRKLENLEGFHYDFYAFPSEYIISQITEKRKTTTITVKLDPQARTLIIPKFTEQDRDLYTYIRYIFIADSLSEGGECQLYLNPIGAIQLESSVSNYTWVLNAEGLTSDVLQFTQSGITIGDISIEIPQHQANYLFIDKKGTSTFRLDFTQLKLVLLSINYQQVNTHSPSLQAYLQNHHSLKLMNSTEHSPIITLTHFSLQDENNQPYQGKAYYVAAEDRLLYTNKIPKTLNEEANLVHFTEDSAYFFNPKSNYLWRADSTQNLAENYVFLSAFENKISNTRFLAGDILPITVENGVIRVVQSFTNDAHEVQRYAVYQIMKNRPPQLNNLGDDILIMNLHIHSMLDKLNSTEQKKQGQNALKNICSNQIFSIKLGNDSYPHLPGKATYAELSPTIRITSLNQTLSSPPLWVDQNSANQYRLINPKLDKLTIFIGSLTTPEGKEVLYFFMPPNKESSGQLYRQVEEDQPANLLASMLISAFFSDKNTLLAYTSDGIVKRIDAFGKAYILSFTKDWTSNQPQWWIAIPHYLAENPPASAYIPIFGITDQAGQPLAVWYDTQDQQLVFAKPPLQRDGRPFRLTYYGQLGDNYFFQNENKIVYYQVAKSPLLSTLFQGSQLKGLLPPLKILSIAEQIYLYQQKIWIHAPNGLLFSFLPQKLESWTLEKIYFQWFNKNNCIDQYDKLKISLSAVIKNEAEYLRFCFHSAFSGNNETLFIPPSFLAQNTTFSFSNASLIPIEKNLDKVTHWWRPTQDQFFLVPEKKNGREWVFLAKTVSQDHYFFNPKEKITYILPADTTMDSKKPYQTLSTELALRSNNTFLWLFRVPYPKVISVPLFVGIEILEIDTVLSPQFQFTLYLSDKNMDHYRTIVFKMTMSEEKNIPASYFSNINLDLEDDTADKLFAREDEQDIVIFHSQYPCQLILIEAMNLAPSIAPYMMVHIRETGVISKKIKLNMLDLQNQLKASNGENIPLWSSQMAQLTPWKNYREIDRDLLHEGLSTQKSTRTRRSLNTNNLTSIRDEAIWELAYDYQNKRDRIQAKQTKQVKRKKNKLTKEIQKNNINYASYSRAITDDSAIDQNRIAIKKEQRYQSYLFKPEKNLDISKRTQKNSKLSEKNSLIQNKLNQVQSSKTTYEHNVFKNLNSKQENYLIKGKSIPIESRQGYLSFDHKLQSFSTSNKKTGISQITAPGDTLGLTFLMRYFFPKKYQSSLPKKIAQTGDKLNQQKNFGQTRVINIP